MVGIDMDECKGKIYKCRINNFINGKGEYVESTRMVPQKKLSCPGCKQCGYLDGEFHESVANNTISISGTPEHNQLYSLNLVVVSTDWETGHADDYYLAFNKINV